MFDTLSIMCKSKITWYHQKNAVSIFSELKLLLISESVVIIFTDFPGFLVCLFSHEMKLILKS